MMDSVLNWMQQNKVAAGVMVVLVILVIVLSTGWGVSSATDKKSGLDSGYLFSYNGGTTPNGPMSAFSQYTGANILALKGDGTDDMPGAYAGCGARRVQRTAEAAAKSSKASFVDDSQLAGIATGDH